MVNFFKESISISNIKNRELRYDINPKQNHVECPQQISDSCIKYKLSTMIYDNRQQATDFV